MIEIVERTDGRFDIVHLSTVIGDWSTLRAALIFLSQSHYMGEIHVISGEYRFVQAPDIPLD